MGEKLEELKKENERLQEEKNVQHEQLMKIKDEPKRLAKNSDMLNNAHLQMKKDLEDILDDLKKKDKTSND